MQKVETLQSQVFGDKAAGYCSLLEKCTDSAWLRKTAMVTQAEGMQVLSNSPFLAICLCSCPSHNRWNLQPVKLQFLMRTLQSFG